MKINSVNNTIGHYRKRNNEHSSTVLREYAYERHNLEHNKDNNDKINTTIRNNSDGRVSFKGGAPLLHNLANFAHHNPLVAEALFAIFITCGARPLSIWATAKTDEDKEKCSFQVAKSISSGLIGLGATAIVGTPIAKAVKKAKEKGAFNMPEGVKEQAQSVVKKGVDVLDDLAEKAVKEGKNTELAKTIKELTHGGKLNLNVLYNKRKKADKKFLNVISEKAPDIAGKVKDAFTNQKILNNYESTAKNVSDKFFQPVFMPLRATITIAMVPVLLSLLGMKKPSSKQKEENPFETLKYNVLQTPNDERVFQSFSGVEKYDSK